MGRGLELESVWQRIEGLPEKHSKASPHSQIPAEADIRRAELAIACDRACDSAEMLLL